jgi:hypothetical protein
MTKTIKINKLLKHRTSHIACGNVLDSALRASPFSRALALPSLMNQLGDQLGDQ